MRLTVWNRRDAKEKAAQKMNGLFAQPYYTGISD